MQYCFTKKYLIKTQKQTFWKLYTLGKLFMKCLPVQESGPSWSQRDTAQQKHGTSLFCDIPELLYKVVQFTPI